MGWTEWDGLLIMIIKFSITMMMLMVGTNNVVVTIITIIIIIRLMNQTSNQPI